MTALSFCPTRSALRSTLAAAALTVTCSAGWAALPSFVIDPAAAGFSGGTAKADNFIVSNYSTTVITGTNFTNTGYLAVEALQLTGSVTPTPGLNSSYGLYVAFNAAGTVAPVGAPLPAGSTFGTFSSLNYTLYGYNGPAATFSVAGNTPTVTGAGNAVALATGSLVKGTVGSTGTVPSANATLTFTRTATGSKFFTSPTPFYLTAETSFTNTSSNVFPFPGGFSVSQGGGQLNFTPSVVPEPETYALMLAGVAGLGIFGRRRRQD
jgi:hypothetical protein